MEATGEPPEASSLAAQSNHNSSKSREDGELSSSQDDFEFPGGINTQLNHRSPVRIKNPQVASVSNKNNLFVVRGKSAPPDNRANLVGVASKPSVHPNHRKGSEKNRVPFVISFSDDDSGSESEEIRQGEIINSKGITREVNGSKKPSTSVEGSQMSRQNAVNKAKINKKMSSNRTFVSSMTRINGTSYRNGGPLSLGPRTHFRNSNTLHETKIGQNVHVNSTKLQDLRQLIAIRENELKLKATKQDMQTALGSSNVYAVMNSRNLAARRKDSGVDVVLIEPREPEKKRRKASEPHSSNLNSVSHQDTTLNQLISAREKSALEICHQHCNDDCSCRDKEILPDERASGASLSGKKMRSNNPPSASAPNGSSTINNNTQCGKNTEQVEPSAPVPIRNSKTSPRKRRISEMKPPSHLNSQHGSSFVLNSSVPKETIPEHNLVSSALYDSISNDQGDKHKSTNSFHIPDSNLEISDAYLNNASFWSDFGNANKSGTGDMDIEYLLEIEDLGDKELDEARELRRKCEIEERSALKAYRKAQRALAEANAKCSYLYRKRELFSAHLRSRMMEDSSLFLSKKPHNQIGAAINPLINMSVDDMNLVTSNHQVQNELNLLRQHQNDPNVRCNDAAFEDFSGLHEDGANLASEPSEANTSISEPEEDREVANAVYSPLHDNALAGDEETLPFHLQAGQSSLDYQGNDEVCNGRTMDANVESTAINAEEDSLLLEASLRSKLFARLGIKNGQKAGSNQGLECTVEKKAQHDLVGEKLEINGNIPSSLAEKGSCDDSGEMDIVRSDAIMAKRPMDISNECSNEKFFFDRETSSMAGPVLRNAFAHIDVSAAIGSVQIQNENIQIHSRHIYTAEGTVDSVYGTTDAGLIPNPRESVNLCANEVSSYNSSLAIDPFWPLCMYELRGKCNNDECSLQHVKDYSSRSIDLGNSKSNYVGKDHAAGNPSMCLDSRSLAPPTYLVCSDILKADAHSYQYLLAQNVGERWRKCFSASLVLSSALPADLLSDEPCLHGTEARIEVHGGWNRQSSYFHGRNSKMSQSDQHMADDEHALEMALLNLNREVNKQKGRMVALEVLARAIEAYPTSSILWIVYLHVYYSNQKSIGKDDMFRWAVEKGESYELWLMFINSRDKLDDRLLAYDNALLALCGDGSASDNDAKVQLSPCILDLFLQMMNCLCISGKADKAVQKIHGLFPSTEKPSESNVMFLPDVLLCLTIHDKCIFWVCCVYLVMYKKLPDAIVEQFEFHKELSAVDWPSAHLTVDEKQLAVRLMETAVDSLALYIDSESLESRATLRTAHLFALNHIRCIEVLEGFECSKNLLGNYASLYPSCLELVLLSARAEESDRIDADYVGFEEALSNWTDKVPGVQCIWYQYAESALQNGKIDFAKELLGRWFHSVWEVHYPMNGTSDFDGWISNSSQTDVAYGLINLSLHKQLQNDHVEARSAIEQALEVASPEDYKQCMQEHAMFMLKANSTSLTSVLNLLKGYLTDSRASLTSDPLSRRFIKCIEKPRVQQLVSNLLSPMSSDISPLNPVLESCYLRPFIQQLPSKLRELVDFVEAIMEIMPANYKLAISLCKLLCKTSNSADISEASVSFWASSIMINSLFQAVPVAPEYVWWESATILRNLTEIQSISESFHKRALSVYPFSMRLWKSYLSLSKNTEHINAVTEAALAKGIKLD